MDDQLQQQLWDYVYGLLPDPEIESIEERISSEPDVARAYAEVRLQAEQLREAARVIHSPVRFSRPESVESSKQKKTPAAASSPGRAPRSRKQWANWIVAAAAGLAAVMAFMGGAESDTETTRVATAPMASRNARLYTEVTTPAHLQLGAGNSFMVRTMDPKTDQPAEASFVYRVLGEGLQRRWESERLQTTREGAVLRTPPLPSDAKFVEVKAENSPAIRVPLQVNEENFTARLTSDKPIYQAGDTMRFRVMALSRFHRRPGKQLAAQVTLESPDGEAIAESTVETAENGLALAQLPAPDVGGSYLLKVRNPDARFDTVTMPLKIRAVAPPQAFAYDLEFAKDSYRGGEQVLADLQIARRGLAAKTATIEAEADIDGESVKVESNRSANGDVQLRFNLPNKVDHLARLNVKVSQEGLEQTIVETVPLQTSSTQVTFLPEGGELVASVKNRVFFVAQDSFQQPRFLSAKILNAEGREVATATVWHQGRGWFEFTPEPQQSYQMMIDGDDTARGLPSPVAFGAAIRANPAVFESGEDLQLQVAVPRQDTACLAIAECRGVSIGQTRWLSSGRPEGDTVRIKVPESLGGVMRITVLTEEEEAWRPAAERLVYRRESQQLQIALERQSSSTAEQFAAALSVRNELGQPVVATLGAWAMPEYLAEHSGRTTPDINAFYSLASELRDGGEIENLNAALRPNDLESTELLELLLGADGWRRFVADNDGLANLEQPLESDAGAAPASVAESFAPPVTLSNRQLVVSATAGLVKVSDSRWRYMTIGICGLGLFVIVLMGLLRLADAKVWTPALAAALILVIVGFNAPRDLPRTTALAPSAETDESNEASVALDALVESESSPADGDPEWNSASAGEMRKTDRLHSERKAAEEADEERDEESPALAELVEKPRGQQKPADSSAAASGVMREKAPRASKVAEASSTPKRVAEPSQYKLDNSSNGLGETVRPKTPAAAAANKTPAEQARRRKAKSVDGKDDSKNEAAGTEAAAVSRNASAVRGAPAKPVPAGAFGSGPGGPTKPMTTRARAIPHAAPKDKEKKQNADKADRKINAHLKLTEEPTTGDSRNRLNDAKKRMARDLLTDKDNAKPERAPAESPPPAAALPQKGVAERARIGGRSTERKAEEEAEKMASRLGRIEGNVDGKIDAKPSLGVRGENQKQDRARPGAANLAAQDPSVSRRVQNLEMVQSINKQNGVNAVGGSSQSLNFRRSLDDRLKMEERIAARFAYRREYFSKSRLRSEETPSPDFFWRPIIETDGEGKAALTIRRRIGAPPQKLVVDAIGDGRVGQTETFIAEAQGVYADFIAPAEVMVGDELRLPLVLNNYSDTAADIKIKLDTTTNFTLEGGETTFTAKLPPRAVGVRQLLKLKTKSPNNDGRIAIDLEANSQSQRIVRTVKVAPAGYPVESIYNGLIDEVKSIQVQVPEDTVAEFQLKAYPSMLSELKDALSNHFVQPAPDVAAADALSNLSLSYLDENRIASLEVTRAAKKIRSSYQLAEASSPLKGKRDFRLKERAKDLGQEVTPKPNKESLQEPAQAKAATAAESPTESLADRGGASPDSNSRMLLSKQVYEAIDLDTARKMLQKKTGAKLAEQTSEDLAEVAQAAIALGRSGKFDAETNDAINWINSKRDGRGGFGSPKETVWALQALSENEAKVYKTQKDTALNVMVAGKTVASKPIQPQALMTFQDLSQFIQPGDNAVKLSVGKGNRVPFVGRLRTWNATAPAPGDLRISVQLSKLQTTIGGTVEIRLKASNQGKEDLQGVVVELPLPGGLSARGVRLDELQRGGEVDHYSATPSKITLFWRSFPAGQSKQLVLDATARVAGKYGSTPASIFQRDAPAKRSFAPTLEVVID